MNKIIVNTNYLEFFFRIHFRHIEDDFEEIENIRDLPLDSLYGNIGGYIGIFLGYSLIQMADALSLLTKWILEKGRKAKTPLEGESPNTNAN